MQLTILRFHQKCFPIFKFLATYKPDQTMVHRKRNSLKYPIEPSCYSIIDYVPLLLQWFFSENTTTTRIFVSCIYTKRRDIL